MAECEKIRDCAFLKEKLREMPSTARLFEKRFCRNSEARCARLMLMNALGKEHVPPDLFPNNEARAVRILEAAKKGG